VWAAEKTTSFTLLWLQVRYVPLAVFFIVLLSLVDVWPTQVCERFQRIPTIFLLLGLLLSHTVFLIRTYALYARARMVLWILVPFIVLEVGVSIAGSINGTAISVPDTPDACFPTSPRRPLGLAMWIFPFAYDSMVFILTVFQSIRVMRTQALPLVTALIKDGTLYYTVVLGAYAINIALYIAVPSPMHDIMAAFSGMITMLMTQRLMLNLRAIILSTPPSPVGAKSVILTTLDSLVCAMGGPLDSWETEESLEETITLQRFDRPPGRDEGVDQEIGDAS